MSEEALVREDKFLQKSTEEFRQDICALEKLLSTVPGAFFGDTSNCPLRHSFADNIYMREIFIPKGMMIVGKLHKHAHPNFLLQGEVLVVTEHTGIQHLRAPVAMISEAGTKRALYTLEDTWWITVHSNITNTTDLTELEDEIIATSYEELQAFLLKGVS